MLIRKPVFFLGQIPQNYAQISIRKLEEIGQECHFSNSRLCVGWWPLRVTVGRVAGHWERWKMTSRGLHVLGPVNNTWLCFSLGSASVRSLGLRIKGKIFQYLIVYEEQWHEKLQTENHGLRYLGKNCVIDVYILMSSNKAYGKDFILCVYCCYLRSFSVKQLNRVYWPQESWNWSKLNLQICQIPKDVTVTQSQVCIIHIEGNFGP